MVNTDEGYEGEILPLIIIRGNTITSGSGDDDQEERMFTKNE